MADPVSGAGDSQTQSETMVGAGGASIVEITLFPGETVSGDTATGTLYVRVRGALVKSYPACAGPPPGEGHLDRGGHYAEPTTAGRYTLAGAVHYTTDTWPTSTIPWGAELRTGDDGEIQFSSNGGGSWKEATGAGGVFTQAWIAFEQRGRAADAAAQNAAHKGDASWTTVTPAPLSDADRQSILTGSRSFFLGPDGKLPATYLANDFGIWAFALLRESGGSLEGTGMFVHTTPLNEQQVASGQPVVLSNSHGCIHVRPTDRDEMMALGYLQKGVAMIVEPYGQKGP